MDDAVLRVLAKSLRYHPAMRHLNISVAGGQDPTQFLDNSAPKLSRNPPPPFVESQHRLRHGTVPRNRKRPPGAATLGIGSELPVAGRVRDRTARRTS